jgi:protein-S-isoprenylcysteine O-methyltransferase Ste14
MTTNQLIILIVSTILIILFSWFVSLREKRYHGIPRFFVFEGLLVLGLVQAKIWFDDPFCFRQIISWILLFASIPYAAAALILFHRHGEHGKNFENTTKLVTKGLYKYIRHPMYTSLLFLGWGMFFKEITPVTIMMIVIITITVFLTCKVEEQEMIVKFGDEYRLYMKTTKLWIPFVI